MTASTRGLSCFSNVQIWQQNPANALEDLTRQIRIDDHKEIPQETLQTGVEAAEKLFYSKNKADQKIGQNFFEAIIESGNEEEFQVIAPFFTHGCDLKKNADSHYSFFHLIKKVISNTYRIESGRAVATQTLSKECESEDPYIREEALEAFGMLLNNSQMKKGEKEVVVAAMRAVARVLDLPYTKSMYEYGIYGHATFLLSNSLIEQCLHHNGDEIVFLVNSLSSKESPFLKREGKELSQKIASRLALAKNLLPSKEITEQVGKLAEGNPSTITENSELFWGLFCNKSQLTPYSPLFDIQCARKCVEKIRPFFQNGKSFYVLSLSQEVFFIEAPAPEMVDLTNRPNNSMHGGTRGDALPGFFDRDVKPYLHLLAEALGHKCTVIETPLDFRVHSGSNIGNGYNFYGRKIAVLFQLA